MKNAHSGAVVVMVVCSASREVLSVGIDRRVAAYREKTNGLGLIPAGSIEEAHTVTIAVCAVSQEAQLIATAAGGEIRLWHKQVTFRAPSRSEGLAIPQRSPQRTVSGSQRGVTFARAIKKDLRHAKTGIYSTRI